MKQWLIYWWDEAAIEEGVPPYCYTTVEEYPDEADPNKIYKDNFGFQGAEPIEEVKS